MDGEEDAGDLPEGVTNLVCGDRDTGAALVSHKIPVMVSITGSTRAGIAWRRRRRPTSRSLTSSWAVRPGRRVQRCRSPSTVEGIKVAGYFNGGQDCTAATRVLCQSGIYDDFVTELGRAAAATRTGYDPDDEDLFYGPINNANQLRHVSGLVERAPEHARVVTGGKQAAIAATSTSQR